MNRHHLILALAIELQLLRGLSGLAAEQPAPADPRAPAAVETSGVKQIPDNLWEQLRQYQNIRAASFAGWSEVDGGILIRTRFGNSVQMHRVYQPEGRREQWTFFDEPVAGRFIPKDSGENLLVVMSQGGSENEQVLHFDRSSGQAKLLTDGKSRNLLGPVSRDGQRMVIHSNKRNGRDTDLYLAACQSSGELTPIMEVNGEFWSATDWSPDGQRLALIKTVSINESYPAILDCKTKELRMLPLEADSPVAVGSLAFDHTGKYVYLTTDAQGEFLQLARLDLHSHESVPLTADLAWDVTDVVVEPQQGAVAFVLNADGASRLFLREGDAQRELPIPLGIVSDLEFSPDGTQLGFTLARPDAPADAYSITLRDGRLERWTISEAGGLPTDKFITPERIEFTSFDGRKIPAYYFRPPGASASNPAAVLISIHGGPEGQYRPFFSGITQYYLREQGIAVIYPNVRGSAGYGKSYLKLDNGVLREDSVKDIGALIDWIGDQPELSVDRVAVQGGSYGGFMVLSSLVNFPDRIKAGIDQVGIADFVTFLENTSPYRQDLRRVEYGDERDPKIKEFFQRISPLRRADSIRAALLVAHGKNDPRVPFSEASQIAERVRNRGGLVWTVYANNEGHGFAKKDNRDYLTAVEVMFLKEQLAK